MRIIYFYLTSVYFTTGTKGYHLFTLTYSTVIMFIQYIVYLTQPSLQSTMKELVFLKR
jgi:hypothetical protein